MAVDLLLSSPVTGTASATSTVIYAQLVASLVAATVQSRSDVAAIYATGSRIRDDEVSG